MMATQKLNPEGKRSLLIQTMKLRSPSHRQTVDGKHAFKFFKLLAISKSFVRCSRQFKVYSLLLDLPEFLHKKMRITVFSAKNQKNCEFKLTLEQSKKLLSIIRPSYFGIQQGKKLFDRFIKEIRDLLHVTDGKVGLFFSKNRIEFCHLSLAEEFSSRLCKIKCTAEMLDHGKFVQKMRLESCEVFNLKSVGQLANILRHDIKKLTVNVDRNHYLVKKELALIPKSEDDLRNTSVENVHLNCKGLHFDETKNLVEVLLEACPSLKNFSIETQESNKNHERCDKKVITKYALIQRQKIMNLKKLLSASPFKPCIKLKLMLSADDATEYDKSWYENIKHKFAGWNCRFDVKFKESDEEMGHQIFGDYEHSAYLTFENKKCKLELDLTVSIFGEEEYDDDSGSDFD